MARMGVPVAFGEGDLNFLDGDMVNALDDEEIARLLTKPLMLDMFAAIALCRRGFGRDIGLANPRRVDQACYECFDVEAFAGGYPGQYVASYGRNVEDERNQPTVFDACEGALAASHLIDCAKKPFAPAAYLSENRFGARVCTFASAIVPDRNWLYKCRAGQVRAIIKWLVRGGQTFTVSGGLNVMPIVLKGAEDTVVALLNPSLDDAAQVHIDACGGMRDAFSGEAITSLSVPAMSLRYVKIQ